MFQMMGVFAEFERAMIYVRAGAGGRSGHKAVLFKVYHPGCACYTFSQAT
jgi:hypothetical protein